MPQIIEVTPETLATVDPAGVYEVKMARSVKHGPTWLRPNAVRIRIPGSTLIELGDAVRTFERFE